MVVILCLIEAKVLSIALFSEAIARKRPYDFFSIHTDKPISRNQIGLSGLSWFSRQLLLRPDW